MSSSKLNNLSIDTPIQQIKDYIKETEENLKHSLQQREKVLTFTYCICNLLKTRPPRDSRVYKHLFQDVTDYNIETCLSHLDDRTITFHSLGKLENFYNLAIKEHQQTIASLNRVHTIIEINKETKKHPSKEWKKPTSIIIALLYKQKKEIARCRKEKDLEGDDQE